MKYVSLYERARQQPLKKLRILATGGERVVRPIFLLGTMRAGTTFFSKCLGSHPDVTLMGFENCMEWSKFGGVPMPTPYSLDPHGPELREDGITPAQKARLRRKFQRQLAFFGARPGTRFFNKNPHLWNRVRLVRDIFPDATLIVISRTPPSTVASLKQLLMRLEKNQGFRHYLPKDPTAGWSISPPADSKDWEPERTFPGGDAAVLAEYWLRCYTYLHRELRDAPNAIFLRYEDFVQAPLDTLRRVEKKAGIGSFDYPILASLDPTRNSRWSDLLTEEEQASLWAYYDAHEAEFRALADICTLPVRTG